MAQIGLNKLVLRQTKASRFSCYAKPFAALCELVERWLPDAKQGYRDGVLLVPVPATDFYAGVVQVGEVTSLGAQWTRRQPHEEPYIEIYAVDAIKPPAQAVRVVLYANSVLQETSDATTSLPYEIVSINASALPDGEPLSPVSMARNQLGLPGGTQASCTTEAFAASVRFWSQHVMAGPETAPLHGPDFPPLTAGVVVPEEEPLYTAVWSSELMRPVQPGDKKPSQPRMLLRAWLAQDPATLVLPPEAWAQSIRYWSQHPLPSPTGEPVPPPDIPVEVQQAFARANKIWQQPRRRM